MKPIVTINIKVMLILIWCAFQICEAWASRRLKWSCKFFAQQVLQQLAQRPAPTTPLTCPARLKTGFISINDSVFHLPANAYAFTVKSLLNIFSWLILLLRLCLARWNCWRKAWTCASRKGTKRWSILALIIVSILMLLCTGNVFQLMLQCIGTIQWGSQLFSGNLVWPLLLEWAKDLAGVVDPRSSYWLLGGWVGAARSDSRRRQHDALLNQLSWEPVWSSNLC